VHHEDDGRRLESLDIHPHETYFATSSERGRWKSSPIIPRTYGAKQFPSSPICPHRRHSTPVKVKSIQNAKSSLLEFREFARRQSSEVIEEPSKYPFLSSSDHNDTEDHRSSSPLPPSSPPTSPLSLAASQLDDCASVCDDMNLDAGYSSDDVRVFSLISLSQPVIEHSRCSSTSTSKTRFSFIQYHVIFPFPVMTAR